MRSPHFEWFDRSSHHVLVSPDCLHCLIFAACVVLYGIRLGRRSSAWPSWLEGFSKRILRSSGNFVFTILYACMPIVSLIRELPHSPFFLPD